MHHEDELRLIAYRIWEEEGNPDGRHLEHWFRAEAIWQQKKDRQIGDTAKDPATRTDLVTASVALDRKRAQKHPRRARR